jgi:tetratricopeptide (TPR) repeat protein
MSQPRTVQHASPFRRFVMLAVACAAVAGTSVGCNSNNSQSPPTGPAVRAADPTDVMLTKQKIKPETYLAAGKVAEGSGRFDDAIANYRALLKDQPEHKEATYRLAITLTLAKRADEALAAWERYVKLTNGSADAWSNFAYTHQLAGNWKEAEASYMRALQVDPNCKSARTNYGLMLAQRGRFDEAEEQLNKVLGAREVQYNLGSVHELRGEYADARACYTAAIAIDRNFREAQQRLRLLDQRLAQPTQADAK